jgi:hypothetical protein
MIAYNQRGNVLPFVVVGVAMAMALGMGMFYMTSTSFLGQAGGSGMERAHQLALAGRDYALANWDNPSQWDRSDRDFTLSAASPTEGFSLEYTGGRIKSTGFVNRNMPFEAKKTITASPPSLVKKSLTESFDDPTLSKWATGSAAGEIGSHATSGQALDVTAATAAAYGPGSGTWSLLQLSASSAGVDLTAPWLNAGRCLSYDLQAKIANVENYYMAGLIFKMSNDHLSFYGVSFLRIRQSWWFGWSDSDDIPSGVKPDAIRTYTNDGYFTRYSKPALVLWKRQGGNFTWLAYKILDNTNLVVDGSEKLVPWSTLQVRLQEVYGFSGGDPNLLKKGAVVIGQTSAARARITEAPIMTSATDGVFRLADVRGTFESGEQLKVGGEAAATLGGRTNLIRVYYGDADATKPDTSDGTLIGNARKRNPRGEMHWPADNDTDWTTANDRMTLVSPWGGLNTGITLLGGTGTEAAAIIKDGSLLTPDSGAIDNSGVALHATGGTATSTFFDDFALQY